MAACTIGKQSAPRRGTSLKRNLPKKIPSVIGNRYTAAANARSSGSTASSFAIRTAAVAARAGWRGGACTERAGDKARAGANAHAGAHTSASTTHAVERMRLRTCDVDSDAPAGRCEVPPKLQGESSGQQDRNVRSFPVEGASSGHQEGHALPKGCRGGWAVWLELPLAQFTRLP